MDTLTVCPCSVQDVRVRAVIDAHFALMRAQSPEESCHVLPADGLQDAFMLGAEDAGAVIGIGALVDIGAGHGEIKSMHTTQAARGRGAGRMILAGLLEEATRRGLDRVSLETGSAPEFAAARALYISAGFSFCAPFGSYEEDPLSVFLTRTL